MSDVEILPPISWDAFSTALEKERVPFLEATASRALELAAISSDATVLDLEADRGTVGWLAARRARRVVCVEDWPRSYERLEERLRAEPLENLSLVRAPTSSLPFEDRSFDAAFWVQPMGLPAGGQRRHLAEVARVLKPGGHLLAMFWRSPRRVDQGDESRLPQLLAALKDNWLCRVRDYRYQLTAPSNVALYYARAAIDGFPADTSRMGRQMRISMAERAVELAQRATGPIEVTGATVVVDAVKGGHASN